MDDGVGEIDDWWGEIDDAVMACLRANAAMSPHEVGSRLDLSEAAVASIICLLALEGKVRIGLAECQSGAQARNARAA